MKLRDFVVRFDLSGFFTDHVGFFFFFGNLLSHVQLPKVASPPSGCLGNGAKDANQTLYPKGEMVKQSMFPFLPSFPSFWLSSRYCFKVQLYISTRGGCTAYNVHSVAVGNEIRLQQCR